MNPDRTLSWDWHPGRVPDNVGLDDSVYLETTYIFGLFRSEVPDAIVFGRGSSAYKGTMFDMGRAARVTVGQFALMHGARVICDSEVHIGDHVLISWNVVLMDSYRVPFDPNQRRIELEQLPSRPLRIAHAAVPTKPIRIERNVWLGFDVCVLPGVTIGEGSVIGARSVVTSDIPPFTLAAGNPAQPIRRLSSNVPTTYG